MVRTVDFSGGRRRRFPGLARFVMVVGWLGFLVCPLGADPPNPQWGVGMESGFAFHQEKVFTQQGSIMTATDSGKPTLRTLELGPTVSWDTEVLPSVLVGVRSTLLLWGPSFPYNWAPRFNARLTYDFSDWLSATLEFPYSPGIGLKFFRKVYLFFGTDSLVVPKQDYVYTSALLYQFSP